jgi:phospholipid/cholesterol/gamma-HCH transport system substrate-binding protein
LKQINEGNGTLSLLLKDPKLYNNLEKVAKDLDKLILDINAYPKRYFSIGSGKKADKERDKDIKNETYKP